VKFARCTVSLTALILSMLAFPHAEADECDGDGDTGGQWVGVQITCSDPSTHSPGTVAPAGGQPDPYLAYRWTSVCATDFDVRPGDLSCAYAMTCPSVDERRWQLWGRLPNGNWTTVTTGCFGGRPPAYVPPTVTPGQVLEALRRVGLPALPTVVQPAGKTLVNFDTNFYTQPQPVTLSLTLLRQRVQVEATPATYRWDFGDGTISTTADPGAAYPDLAVTHRYADARVTVFPSVETTYTARFRVGSGDWQDVGGTVTAAGPSTALRIAEATPLLSGEHG
jgi:hypothetical protein